MADVGKKRKRVTNGVDSPNKKTLHGEHTGPVAVTFADDRSLHPVIAVSRGIKTPSIAFSAYAKPQRSGDDRIPKPITHSLILQSSKHLRLDYSAAPLATNDNLAHYVAVLDPETNSIQITPAHHVQMQCVPREEASPEETPRKSLASQRIALGQEFGTKKAKKGIASRTVNAITAAPLGAKDDVRTAILEEVAEQTGKETVVDLATQLSAKPIPKPNLDAATVEEVYPLTTLIPVGDMRHLTVKEWQEKARAEENVAQPHRFTAFRVAALGKTNDISRLKALRYLGLLLQFHDALIKAGKAGKKVPRKEILSEKLKDFPEALISGVRQKFSDEKNELSKWHLENLHTHICALSLFVDQWNTDTSNIRDDLKLVNKTVSQYFTELGCKVDRMTEKERAAKNYNKAQASTVRMARLKLPLDFPKLRTGRRM